MSRSDPSPFADQAVAATYEDSYASPGGGWRTKLEGALILELLARSCLPAGGVLGWSLPGNAPGA